MSFELIFFCAAVRVLLVMEKGSHLEGCRWGDRSAVFHHCTRRIQSIDVRRDARPELVGSHIDAAVLAGTTRRRCNLRQHSEGLEQHAHEDERE